MDDMKLFGRSQEKLERLIEIATVFAKDIVMGFKLDMCDMLILNQGIKILCGKIVLPDSRMTVEVKDSGYKI